MKSRWWVVGLVLFAAILVENAGAGLFGRWAARRCGTYHCASQCSQPAVQTCGSTSYSSGVVYSEGTVVYAQSGDCGVTYGVPVVSPPASSSCGPNGCNLGNAPQGTTVVAPTVIAPSPMPLNVAPAAPAPMPTPAVPPPVVKPAPVPTPAVPPAPVETKNVPPPPVAPSAPKSEPTPAVPPKPVAPPAVAPPPVAPAAAPSAPAAPPPGVPPPVVAAPKDLKGIAKNAQDHVDAQRREQAAKAAAEAKKLREQAKNLEKSNEKVLADSKAEILASAAKIEARVSEAKYRDLRADLAALESTVQKTEAKLNDQIATLPAGFRDQAVRAKEKIVAELKDIVRRENEKLEEVSARIALKSVAPAAGESRKTEFVAKDQARVNDPNAPPTPTEE